MGDSFVWDDHTWDQIWERTLNQAERHHIAMSVLRRRLPSTPLEQRVARELARRWGRRAVTLSVVYALWTLFWGGIGWTGVRLHGAAEAAVAIGCTAVGALAVIACLGFRHSMGRLQAPGGARGGS